MKNIKKSEQKWKNKLTAEQFRILREKGTEAQFSGEYVNFSNDGKYVCAGCGNELFDSKTKFDSHCGWPSFYDAKKDAVEFTKDFSHGMRRIEVACKKCGGHLGHVFDDAPDMPTGKRFCINSGALKFRGKRG